MLKNVPLPFSGEKVAEKVAVFVDIGNLYYCVGRKWVGRRLDYERLLKFVTNDNNLCRAFAYGTEKKDEAANFKGYLKSIGFEPKYKRARHREQNEFHRTDWSVGIAMDVVRLIQRVDCIIICTANPDFVPLVEWIREQGVRCVVVGCGISKVLYQSSDKAIEVTADLLLVEGNR